MDGVTIQQRIYAGRGKAALRIGMDCAQYRPITASAPLGNPQGTIKAAFNAGDSTYAKASSYGAPVWYADMDGRVTQAGDYLVRALDGETWFVAAQQQLLPILTVNCNRRLRISRQATGAGGVGLQSYGSTSPCDPNGMGNLLGTAAAMWPAAVLLGGRSQQNATHLPSGVQQAGWKLLLPPSVPVVLAAGDIATDDLGRRFVIVGAELTDLGWRLVASEVHG